MTEDTATPIVSVAIAPRTVDEHERLDRGLRELAADDPTLRVQTDPQSGQVTIAGMGELHLEIVVNRLRSEFGVKARAGQPQVVYKETITRSANGDARYVERAGRSGHFGHVRIRLHPGRPGTGYVFQNTMAGEPLRDEFVDAARDGITEALSRGVLAGFPMDDVRVELYDGSCLDPDSSRAGFRMAGAMAFRSAAKEAGPVLLEPVMRVTVTLPIEHVADVMESLAGRHVVMQSREDRGGAHIIQALAPLTQMFGYAADLRSRTRGRGSCSLHLDRYQPVSRQP